MTLEEFSNEFDTLYNNITSNQAPGLDEYEKSVFLTKAQEEILLAYFDPRTNKVLEGYDGSERRQIDFSMVTKSKVYEDELFVVLEFNTKYYSPTHKDAIDWSKVPITISSKAKKDFVCFENYTKGYYTVYPSDEGSYAEEGKDANEYIKIFLESLGSEHIYTRDTPNSIKIFNPTYEFRKKFDEPVFDLRDNTRSIVLDNDILMIINESVDVLRGKNKKREKLVVIPIHYQEYSRMMSKPHKRPLKYQAWRLIDNTDNVRRSEIILGPADTLERYILRYIRRPHAIIIDELDEGLTINGEKYTGSNCELDPIIHHEILQRAVELAKASYAGDINTIIGLGNTSQTEIGVVPQQSK